MWNTEHGTTLTIQKSQHLAVQKLNTEIEVNFLAANNGWKFDRPGVNMNGMVI